MSERSSFVTEYIQCDKCLAALGPYLLTRQKYLCGIQVPSWNDGKMLPVIAGKIGATYSGGEWETLDDIFDEAGKFNFICHPIRVAVLQDNGWSTIFIIHPDSTVEEHAQVERKE